MAAEETRELRRIAVMTSGGDAPGMNACIRAVVRYARHFGIDTLGVQRGYAGLVRGEFQPLGLRDVGDRLQQGGTFLKTARLPEFELETVQREAISMLKDKQVEGLIVIGGDGSLAGAMALHKLGFPVVGIPGSIDNDIAGTQASIGTDTALNTILDAVDRLRDTASSHGRVLIVETMGRNCGYLAQMAGFTGGAEVIHVPEVKMTLEEIVRTVESAWARGKAHAIITVAEGAEHKADTIANHLSSKHPEYICRVTILGHVQRGGRPSHFDRYLASRMGVRAVEALRMGEQGVMVALQSMHFVTVALEDVVGKPNLVSTRDYEITRILAE
jgi:6-phosphofructokinase 1